MRPHSRRSFVLGVAGAIGLLAACGQGEFIVTPGKKKKQPMELPDPTDDDEHVEGEPEQEPTPVETQPGKPEWTTKAKALVSKNEGGKVYTVEAPGPFAGKERSHVPKVTIEAGVTTIWVEDDQGRVLALRELKATESAPPAFAFKLPNGTKKVRAFEHCNLHGVWASDEVVT